MMISDQVVLQDNTDNTSLIGWSCNGGNDRIPCDWFEIKNLVQYWLYALTKLQETFNEEYFEIFY